MKIQPKQLKAKTYFLNKINNIDNLLASLIKKMMKIKFRMKQTYTKRLNK